MALLSWFKRNDKFCTYACSGDRPDQIEKMREQGFIPMSEHISQLIKKASENNNGTL